MFRTPVQLTPPFTQDLYRITESFEEIAMDRSLFMTATILLHNRVENLKLKSTITRNETIPFCSDPGVYAFHWIESTKDPDEFLDVISDKYKTVERFDAVENFVKEKFNQTIHVRIFPEENTVCLFLDKLSTEMWHLMQSFISRYFKVFKEKPLNEAEIDFVRSLTLRTAANYTQRMLELTDTDEFRTFSLRIQLDKFEKAIYECKLSSARNDVTMCDRTIEHLLEEYRAATAKLLEAKIRYEGLTSMVNNTEDKTELQEYLIGNKNITKITIQDAHIKFIVKTYLIPYLTDSWDTMSRRGNIFDRLPGVFANKDDAKLLLDAIFSEDHSLKLKMCAYIDLDYLGGTVSSARSYDYSQIKGYVPNPHLYYHNCFGQNGPDIVAQLKMGDPIGAIECAINCVKHVNIDEVNATFRPFLEYLGRYDKNCIVTEAGEEMTIAEAIEYLKGLKDESNKTEQRDETDVA